MITQKLLQWFEGYSVVRIPVFEEADSATKENLLNIMLANCVMYRDLRCGSDGGISFVISRKDCKKLRPLLDKSGLGVYIISEKGLPAILGRYRRRPGIAAGVLLFALALYLSSRLAWTMEIVGNDTVPSSEIETLLYEQGCHVGSYLPSLDLYKICSESLVRSDKISWIAVNIIGTCLSVEVRERIPGVEDIKSPSNIIASREGEVASVTPGSGTAVVSAGDAVSEGQLLISGAVDIKNGGYRLVRSTGTVYAVTTDTFTVSVPLEYTEAVPTGKRRVNRTLSALGHSIKLYIGDGVPDEPYISETVASPLTLFGIIHLPLNVTETVYDFTEDEKMTRTEEDARLIAMSEMYRRIASATSDGELLTRRSAGGVDAVSGEYRLTCVITVLRDIAREVPMAGY